MSPKRPSALRAWLELLRAPNLLSVPGDPLVGVALAVQTAPPQVWAAAGAASVLLYAAGLVQNDWADRRADATERPERPIPSGRIRPGAAMAAWAGLIALGLASAGLAGPRTLATGAVLAAAICTYNLLTKRWPVVGPVNMGLCRALSVCVGLAAGAEAAGARDAWAGPPRPWLGLTPMHLIPAGLIGAYVAALTAVARGEARKRRVGWVRNLPACIVAFAVVPAVADAAGDPPPLGEAWNYWASLAALLAALLWSGGCAIRLGLARSPREVQRNVGRLIRGLMLLQAWLLLAAGAPGMYIGFGVILAFLAAGPLGRRFAPS